VKRRQTSPLLPIMCIFCRPYVGYDRGCTLGPGTLSRMQDTPRFHTSLPGDVFHRTVRSFLGCTYLWPEHGRSFTGFLD
jgi:hypothetical protein